MSSTLPLQTSYKSSDLRLIKQVQHYTEQGIMVRTKHRTRNYGSDETNDSLRWKQKDEKKHITTACSVVLPVEVKGRVSKHSHEHHELNTNINFFPDSFLIVLHTALTDKQRLFFKISFHNRSGMVAYRSAVWYPKDYPVKWSNVNGKI